MQWQMHIFYTLLCKRKWQCTVSKFLIDHIIVLLFCIFFYFQMKKGWIKEIELLWWKNNLNISNFYIVQFSNFPWFPAEGSTSKFLATYHLSSCIQYGFRMWKNRYMYFAQEREYSCPADYFLAAQCHVIDWKMKNHR